MQAPILLPQLDLAGEENSGAPPTTEPEQRGLGYDQRGPRWVRSQKTEDKKNPGNYFWCNNNSTKMVLCNSEQ